MENDDEPSTPAPATDTMKEETREKVKKTKKEEIYLTIDPSVVVHRLLSVYFGAHPKT